MGRLYGMSEEEVDAKLEEILAFADIGRFVDLPVRSYSTGMRARLAFSIVTSVDPDILLIDEALSVGDVGFALQVPRARARAVRTRRDGRHRLARPERDPRDVRARDLDPRRARRRGRRPGFGRRGLSRGRARARRGRADEALRRARAAADARRPRRDRVAALQSNGEQRFLYRLEEPFEVEAHLTAREAVDDVHASLEVVRFDGVRVLVDERRGLDVPAGESVLRARVDPLRLGRFTYEVQLQLRDGSGSGAGGGPARVRRARRPARLPRRDTTSRSSGARSRRPSPRDHDDAYDDGDAAGAQPVAYGRAAPARAAPARASDALRRLARGRVLGADQPARAGRRLRRARHRDLQGAPARHRPEPVRLRRSSSSRG